MKPGMPELTLDWQVGRVVREYPGASRVLERAGIDYCCGGGKRLGDACAAKGVNGQEVLDAVLKTRDSGNAFWYWPEEARLTDLCRHIVNKHHAWTREELPRLRGLLTKVISRHGEKHPELADVVRVFDGLAEEMGQHMSKEEAVLFPGIAQLEAGERFDFLTGVTGRMVHEHEEAGRALKELRRLTHGYEPPAGACPTFVALYAGLAELEADLHTHIHKENNVLFVRAAGLTKPGGGVGVV